METHNGTPPTLGTTPEGFALSGHVTFEHALPLYRQGVILFQFTQQVNLDLSKVTNSDSGILALLSAWMRWCLSQGKTLHLKQPSPALRHLMALCDTDSLFGGSISCDNS